MFMFPSAIAFFIAIISSVGLMPALAASVPYISSIALAAASIASASFPFACRDCCLTFSAISMYINP